MLTPSNKPSDFGYYGIVYKAVNIVNGKLYIGITTGSLKKRVKGHIDSSGENKKYYTLFHKAIRKYGKECFSFEILKVCKTADDLEESERFYIAEHKTKVPNGYNLTSGGEVGKKLSEETKKRIAATKKGKKASLSLRKKLSAAQKSRGRTIEELEHIRNLGKSGKGRKVSLSTLKKMSEANKGKKLLEDTKIKIGNSNRGLKRSLAARINISKGQEKAVLQFDVSGNFLGEFESLSDVTKTFGIDTSSVSKVCRGKLKSCGGFVWRYKNGGRNYK